MDKVKPSMIALIPARGGSKGVKGKNIKELAGKPLIAYAIEAALQCTDIDRIIVSTDRAEIADIAREYGAEVPFLRPAHLAEDQSSDRVVMLHLLDFLERSGSALPDFLTYLRPTTPFKSSDLISICYQKLCKNPDASALRTVTASEGVFHPYWMFGKGKDQFLKPFVDGISISKYYRRQMLPDCYRLNGVVDILRPDIIRKSDDIYGSNIAFQEVNEQQALDIDTEMDFLFAEFLMSQNRP